MFGWHMLLVCTVSFYILNTPQTHVGAEIQISLGDA